VKTQEGLKIKKRTAVKGGNVNGVEGLQGWRAKRRKKSGLCVFWKLFRGKNYAFKGG